MESKNIYSKLFEARKFIKTCGEEKKGWNDYSKYKYYTPEQISHLTFMASEDQKILPVFDLKRNDLGITGFLTIYDMESDQKVVFEMASAIPEIKATNAAQQLGGAVTYTERYLLSVAFDIKDNNLDFDTTVPDADKKQQKQAKSQDSEPDKKWLNKWTDKAKTKEDSYYWKVVKNAKDNNKTVKDLLLVFKISKEIQDQLEIDLK